jgi:hypothetical protein
MAEMMMPAPKGAPATAPAPAAKGGPAPMEAGPEGAAMRERAANAMMDKERARYEAMAAAAPKPKKPYSATTVTTLIDTFNETLDKLGGQDLPNVEVDLAGAERWDQPLPRGRGRGHGRGGRRRGGYALACEGRGEEGGGEVRQDALNETACA